MSSENVKKRSFKMYNFRMRLIIAIIKDISILNAIRMPRNFNNITMMNNFVKNLIEIYSHFSPPKILDCYYITTNGKMSIYLICQKH